jgi:hypothetical protein
MGLDLGQAQEFTALAVLQEDGQHAEGRTVWAVRLLKRWPRGTSYPTIVADVTEQAHQLGNPVLVWTARVLGGRWWTCYAGPVFRAGLSQC